VDENTDEEGWEYAFDFHLGKKKKWSKKPTTTDYVRRRKWMRVRKPIQESNSSTSSSPSSNLSSAMELSYRAHPLIVEQLRCVSLPDVSHLLATALYRAKDYSNSIAQFNAASLYVSTTNTWPKNTYDPQWIHFLFNRGLAQLHAKGESVYPTKLYKNEIANILPNVAVDVINIILQYQDIENQGFIEAANDFTKVIEYRYGKRKVEDTVEIKGIPKIEEEYTPREREYNLDITIHDLFGLRAACYINGGDSEAAEVDANRFKQVDSHDSSFGQLMHAVVPNSLLRESIYIKGQSVKKIYNEIQEKKRQQELEKFQDNEEFYTSGMINVENTSVKTLKMVEALGLDIHEIDYLLLHALEHQMN